MPAARFGRWLPLALLLSLVGGAGCAWARKASVDVVDPQLRASTEPISRDVHPDGFRLGRYAVAEPGLVREEPDEGRMLGRDGAPRPIEQHRLSLDVLADGSDRAWSVRCVSQRRRPAAIEYSAALDENRDEIAVQCDIADAGPKWILRTEAQLSSNFAGRLDAADGERSLTVEVLLFAERWGRLQRHLPDPVAQIRDGDRIVAAMVLAKPEQAWLHPELDPVEADVAMAALLGLRFLPLGLEG